jgi:hypothetical protein
MEDEERLTQGDYGGTQSCSSPGRPPETVTHRDHCRIRQPTKPERVIEISPPKAGPLRRRGRTACGDRRRVSFHRRLLKKTRWRSGQICRRGRSGR